MNNGEWRDYLKTMDEGLKHVRPAAQSKYITMEGYVRRHGHYFGPWTEPHKNMAQGECYANAALYAVEHGLVYCEGYAEGMMPLPHAWCYDPDEGLVHDPTWWQHEWHHDTPPSYFGFALSVDDLMVHVQYTGYYGVLGSGDYRNVSEILLDEYTLPFMGRTELGL